MSIVGPQTGGDPMAETKFVRPSLQTLGTELGTRGFSICPTTVARLLRGQAIRPGEHQLDRPVVAEPGDPAGLGTEVGGVGVTASLDLATYPTKVKVTKTEMQGLDLEKHEDCPDWNDTIGPRQAVLRN